MTEKPGGCCDVRIEKHPQTKSLNPIPQTSNPTSPKSLSLVATPLLQSQDSCGREPVTGIQARRAREAHALRQGRMRQLPLAKGLQDTWAWGFSS